MSKTKELVRNEAFRNSIQKWLKSFWKESSMKKMKMRILKIIGILIMRLNS